MRLNVVPHVRDFSSGRFPKDNLTKILHASLVYLTLATRPAHCSHLDFTKNPYNLTPVLKLRKVFQVGGIPLGVSLIRYIRSYRPSPLSATRGRAVSVTRYIFSTNNPILEGTV
jgi:hypothetical protein